MISLYSAFFAVGVVVFFTTHRFGIVRRILLASVIFVLPSLILTLVALTKGDKPPLGSRTITPEELYREGK